MQLLAQIKQAVWVGCVAVFVQIFCGPSGAFAVAGIAAAIVFAIYVGFYFLVYLSRGVVQ